MKILIATPYYSPKVGGLENYAEHIAQGLAKLGWDVHVLTSGDSTNSKISNGITIHTLKTWAIVANTPLSPLWTLQARRLIKQIQPDIINVHAPVPSMALAVKFAAGKTPLIVTYHAGSMRKGRIVPDTLIWIYEHLFLPGLLKRSDAIICASDFVRDEFLATWKSKSTTITPGVDSKMFVPSPQKRVPGRVVFIGDYRDPRKGLDYLETAVALVPGASLRVVGPGDGTNTPFITYAGIVRGAALVGELQSAQMLVLPSTTDAESFGMVLIEAMAAGIPVIGTDIGGIPYVISNGVDGLLVPPANEMQLAEAIRQLMDHPEAADKLAARGRSKAVRDFSWSDRITATRKTFESVAQRAPGVKGKRVFFLHNVISPYRLPVFEEINKVVDLEVNFCITKTSDRKWGTSLGGYSFKHRVLKSLRFGPFILNPTLLSVLLTHSYDIYLVGDFPETALSTFLTIMIAKLRRKPVVLWSETTDNNVIYFQGMVMSPKLRHRFAIATLNTIIAGYRNLLLGRANSYAALSNNARQFLLSQNIKADKIYSGIQVFPSELLPAPNAAKTSSPYAGKKLLLYLGYFNMLKGIDDLIAAVGLVKDNDILLLIAGAGPEEARLKELAAGDPRIQFLGYTEGVQKANLMHWADLFILPTLADCWGLVVNESLHYGTPVITTTAAGSSELIADGVNGIRVAPNDPQALASILSLLITDSLQLTKLNQGAKSTSRDITDSSVGAKPLIDAIMAAGAAQ